MTTTTSTEALDTMRRIENELALLLDGMDQKSDYAHYNKVKRMLEVASIKRIQLEMSMIE